MAAPDVLAPAVLDYLSHGQYPESDAIASASLSSDALSKLLAALHEAQEDIKTEIRAESEGTAPDIDSWIARAKELQADIVRSRDTARRIVAEAEDGERLKAARRDADRKVELLEREVLFNETLCGTLDHVHHANQLLIKVQDEALKVDIGGAFARLEDAESSIAGLLAVEATKIYDVLHKRMTSLKDDLAETTAECWEALMTVNPEEGQITINRTGMPADLPESVVPTISLDAIIQAAKNFNVFDTLVKKMSKNIDKAVLKPRLQADEIGFVSKFAVSGDILSCTGQVEDPAIASVFADLRVVFDFLDSRLSRPVTLPLSELLMPMVTTRLQRQWLEPAIPLDMSMMAEFQTTLDDVSSFAEYLESLEWHGSDDLRAWIQDAPRAWLTKRREAVLGDVRNFVFTGIRETKTVERVETQKLSRAEAQAVTNGGVGNGDDEWDAWDETEKDSTGASALKDTTEAADEEDMSAWGMEDDVDVSDSKAEQEDDDTSAWDVEDDAAPQKSRDDEEEAWGWDDEGSSSKPINKMPTNQRPPVEANVAGDDGERELTLRETFTCTSVPDGVLEIIQQIVTDAQALAGPDFSASPIVPAAAALYALPTLALAIFRATAPTAYTKLNTGNMLIYNDSTWLADQLRAWQADRLPSSRLRLDNDVKALETFAKRAHGTEMEAQRTILRDLIDGAQGFSNCTVAPFKAECESAVEQTVDRLREVHRQWQGILSDSALLQSLGSLLATVTAKILLDIEDLEDISEADSHQLRALIEQMAGIKGIFQQSQQQSEGTEGPDMTFIYCPNWSKFLYMAEILDSSLADIKYMWNDGELSLEYGAEEIVELIEALFAESELRRQAIREVRRGGKA